MDVMQVDSMFVLEKNTTVKFRNICVVCKDLTELKIQNRGSWLH